MNASAQTRAALSAIALGVTLFPCGAAQGQVRADNGAFVTERISDILENERTGTMVRWSDPKTGDVGTITIERTYEQIDGSPCRDYVRTTERPGAQEDRVFGTGCRENDGRWLVREKEVLAASPPEEPSPPEPEPELSSDPPPPTKLEETPAAPPKPKAKVAPPPIPATLPRRSD